MRVFAVLLLCRWQVSTCERDEFNFLELEQPESPPDTVKPVESSPKAVEAAAEPGCDFTAGTLNILNHEKSKPVLPGIVYMSEDARARKLNGQWFKEVLRHVTDSQTDIMSLQEVSANDLVMLHDDHTERQKLMKAWQTHALAAGWSGNVEAASLQVKAFSEEIASMQAMLENRDENQAVRTSFDVACDILSSLGEIIQLIVQDCRKVPDASGFYDACSDVNVLSSAATGLLHVMRNAKGASAEDTRMALIDHRSTAAALTRCLRRIVTSIENSLSHTEEIGNVISRYVQREFHANYGVVVANVLNTAGKQDVTVLLYNETTIQLDKKSCKSNGHFIACTVQVMGSGCEGLKADIIGGHAASDGIHKTSMPKGVAWTPCSSDCDAGTNPMIPNLLMADANLDLRKTEDVDKFKTKLDSSNEFKFPTDLAPTSLKTIGEYRKVAQIIQNTENFVDVGVCSVDVQPQTSCQAMSCSNAKRRSCDMCCEFNENDGKTKGLQSFTAKQTCKYTNRICYVGQKASTVQKLIAKRILGEDQAKKLLRSEEEMRKFFSELDLSQLLGVICFERDPAAGQASSRNAFFQDWVIRLKRLLGMQVPKEAELSVPEAEHGSHVELQDVSVENAKKAFCERNFPLSELKDRQGEFTIDKKMGDIIAARNPFTILSSKIFMQSEIQQSAQDEASQKLFWKAKDASADKPAVYPPPIWPSDHFLVQAKVRLNRQD